MSSLDYQNTFPELRRQIDQIFLNNNMLNVIYNIHVLNTNNLIAINFAVNNLLGIQLLPSIHCCESLNSKGLTIQQRHFQNKYCLYPLSYHIQYIL